MLKKRTAIRRVESSKSKRRSIRVVNILCTNKTKLKGHSQINDQIKCNIYAWITRYPQVIQSPISNNCLKVISDYQT